MRTCLAAQDQGWPFDSTWVQGQHADTVHAITDYEALLLAATEDRTCWLRRSYNAPVPEAFVIKAEAVTEEAEEP